MKIVITLDIDDVYRDEILNDIVGLELKCTDNTAFEYEEFTLKPMPQKLDANDWHRMFDGEYKIREAKGKGYNACIEEILGEQE